MSGLAPRLTPHGRLLLEPAEDLPALPADRTKRLVDAFARGSGHGLLQLGAGEVGAALPAVLGYWRDFGARFVTAVCTLPDVEERRAAIELPAPPADDLSALASAAPPMTGAEYLTPVVLRDLWAETGEAFRTQLAESRAPIQEWLKRWSPAWNLVGRVHFNLAENRKDEQAPFAFLATYTTHLSAHGKAQHLPLGQALRDYAGAAKRDSLLSLLLPVQRAAEKCAWLKTMIDEGEVFHPLRWTPRDALRLLKDQPQLEGAGVIVRVPGQWKAGRSAPRPEP
jgi:non-specific serine/threonine protein kinase